MSKMQENHSDKVLEQWVAVLRYDPDTKIPIFHTTGKYKGKYIVNASDVMSAMTQFDLMNVFYTDVIRYVDDDQIYLFNDKKI